MPRPKSFDPETALSQAMSVFWEKGYESASIADLTAAMGINRFSLYDTFGDKHALYLKALDYYTQCNVNTAIEQIEKIDSIEGFRQYLEKQIDPKGSCARKSMCMMHKAGVSMSSDDPDAKARIEQTTARVLDAYRQALVRIRDRGELRDGVDLDVTAWTIMVTKAGILSFNVVPIPSETGGAVIRNLLDSIRF